MGLFWVGSGAMPTTGQRTAVSTTSATTKTILQLQAASTRGFAVVAFGVEFTAVLSAAATVELIDTATVAATMTTAHVAAGVQPYDAGADNTAVSTLALGTSATGYNAASASEGSITSTRTAKEKIIPTGAAEYEWEWSLGREFWVPAGHNLRVRVTPSSGTPSVLCWVLINE